MTKKTKFVITAMALFLAFNFGMTKYKSSDSYLRDRVVKLKSDRGSCSGIEVRAPSGKSYILTAAHCRVLVNEQNEVTAVNEQGEERTEHFIAEDVNSDLMLLTNDNNDAVSVGSYIERHDHVHTITHGRGHDAYRTDGEIIETMATMIPISVIANMDELIECIKSPKNTVIPSLDGMFCAIYTQQTYSTAMVVPGSSGGALFDEDGRLVGIVSATDGTFSTFVRLSDIRAFLANR